MEKLEPIRILLDSRNKYNTSLGNNYDKLQQKKTDTTHWETKGLYLSLLIHINQE